MDFILERLAHDDKSTKSQWLRDGTVHICFAMERAIDGDHPRIPPGRYQMIRRPVGSSRFDTDPFNYPRRFPWWRGVIEIANVPSRSAIEVHPANYVDQLLGCVAPGTSMVYDAVRGWTVAGGTSAPAVQTLYTTYLYPSIEAGPTFVVVRDSDMPSKFPAASEPASHG